jgi:hypothetical protein
MRKPLPQFTSAYAIHPNTAELLEPPAQPVGFLAIPYIVTGYGGGCKWALVPASSTLDEVRHCFQESPAQQLASLGWEIFDPADGQPADWDGQRVKNTLMKMVGLPGRWVITGEARSFCELANALSCSGFQADHFHIVVSEKKDRVITLHVRPDGRIVSKGGMVVPSTLKPSIFVRCIVDERHKR